MPEEVNTLAIQLRAMADVVESLGILSATISDGIYVYEYSAESYAMMVRKCTRSPLLGSGEKYATDYTSTTEFRLVGHPSVRVSVNTSRSNVCRRIEVGVRQETRPDPNAPHITVDVPVYEWECSPIMSNLP
jgi:hypothetical protein